jgi:hypothetical protein
MVKVTTWRSRPSAGAVKVVPVSLVDLKALPLSVDVAEDLAAPKG